MKGKALFTWLLLAFVAISLGRVVVTHWLPAAVTKTPPEAAASGGPGRDSAATVAAALDMRPAALPITGRREPVQADRGAPVDARRGVTHEEATPSAAPAGGAPIAAVPEPAPARVVVYYFHGAVRCKTCRTIEDYTREALDDGFSQDLKSGRVLFQLVNVDDPKHEHFVQDYQLTARSVVLSRVENGRETSWRRLDWVWELVKDHDSFLREFQKELRALLEARG
jgi:hypothetical protein